MSSGIVIFCYDGVYSYSDTCNFNIKQIKQYLNLPVTVITDTETKQKLHGADDYIIMEKEKGNSRYFRSLDKTIEWYNLNRYSVFFNSPYEKTLVIDHDYIVYSDNLKQLLETDYDFMCYTKAKDGTGRNSVENIKVGKFDIPFCWATVMMIKKSNFCKLLGHMMYQIRSNYQYFRRLYRINESNYRNDHALSIATHQLNGFKDHLNVIPGHLLTLTDNVDAILFNDHIDFIYTKEDQRFRSKIHNTDVHIINKVLTYA